MCIFKCFCFRQISYTPCAVRVYVACETGCVGRCVAPAGDGVPQQPDPGSDVNVHLTGTQEGFT